jgi:hypothetical protein
MSQVMIIADAVRDTMNAHAFSIPFVAQRAYVPIHEMRGLQDLAVTVVAKDIVSPLLDRQGRRLCSYMIDVGIQKIIGSGPMSEDQIAAANDPLMTLAEEIIDYFFALDSNSLPGVPECVCTEALNEPIYHPDHVDERRVFTSVITFTFKLAR